MTDIMKYFPVTNKITEPRTLKHLNGTVITQGDIVHEIIDNIMDGNTDITLCAPVGTGKSIMGLWAARALTDIKQTKAVYTSPLNTLVDQFDNNFAPAYVRTLKGREHYQCIAGASNCAVGYCKQKICSVTKQVPRECKTCDDRDNCICNNCIYKSTLGTFRNARIGNTNFSIYMLGLSDAEIVIIDECDEVESFVRMHYTVTIPQIIQSSDYSKHMHILENIRDENTVDIELHMEGTVFLDVRTLLKKERQNNAITNILSDYDKRKAWCISHTDKNTIYQPIDVSRYLEKTLSGKIVIRMSATPYKIPESTLIEVDSNFPAENRQWSYMPVGKMGRQHRDDTFDKIALFLDKLVGKTVVHCHSYAIAKNIERALGKIKCRKQLYLQVSNVFSEGYTRQDIVHSFKMSRDINAIMLSVNLTRGVDFPEYDIVNNVIVKHPWLNPTDELVRAKNSMLKNVRWQDDEIANTIMQAYGRLPRSSDKESMCYILDTDFNSRNGRGMTKTWYDKNKHKFFKWFTEAEISGNVCEYCGKMSEYTYFVKYDDYTGMVCHDCNKKLYEKYGG